MGAMLPDIGNARKPVTRDFLQSSGSAMLASMTDFAALSVPIHHPLQRAATPALFPLQDSVTCVSNTPQTAPEPERMSGA
jgi:hypothetical protein